MFDNKLIKQKIYDKIEKILKYPSADRTNTFQKNKSEYTIPQSPTELYSFEQLMDKRIQDFDDNSVLLWSGGIDSTLILSAFIKHNKKVKVLCNFATACEYPWLFFKILDGDYPNIKINFNEEYIYDTNSIITNGSGFDELLGWHGTLFYNCDWQDNYENYISKKDLIFTKILIDKCNYKVQSLWDYYWWLYFSQIWDCIQYYGRCFVRENMPQEFDISLYKPFVNETFQQWAMGDYGKQARSKITTRKNHKKIYKKYIYSVLQDKVYFNNKIKASSPQTIFMGAKVMQIKDDLENITMEMLKSNLPYYKNLCQSLYKKEIELYYNIFYTTEEDASNIPEALRKNLKQEIL